MSGHPYRAATFKSLLDTYGERVYNAAKQALQDNADMVVEEAKSRCPVDTGDLKESIHAETKRKGERVDVVADARHNGYAYGKIVEFSPRINKPFLYPACDATRERRREHMIEMIREALHR